MDKPQIRTQAPAVGISELTKPVCPRCGAAIDWYERYRKGDRKGDRVYLYAVHVDPDSGRRRKCYLGPAEGYVHAKVTHPMLSLRGFAQDVELDWDRRVDYVVELLESFQNCHDEDALRRLLENLRAYAEILEKRISRV